MAEMSVSSVEMGGELCRKLHALHRLHGYMGDARNCAKCHRAEGSSRFDWGRVGLDSSGNLRGRRTYPVGARGLAQR